MASKLTFLGVAISTLFLCIFSGHAEEASSLSDRYLYAKLPFSQVATSVSAFYRPEGKDASFVSVSGAFLLSSASSGEELLSWGGVLSGRVQTEATLSDSALSEIAEENDDEDLPNSYERLMLLVTGEDDRERLFFLSSGEFQMLPAFSLDETRDTIAYSREELVEQQKENERLEAEYLRLQKDADLISGIEKLERFQLVVQQAKSSQKRLKSQLEIIDEALALVAQVKDPKDVVEQKQQLQDQLAKVQVIQRQREEELASSQYE